MPFPRVRAQWEMQTAGFRVAETTSYGDNRYAMSAFNWLWANYYIRE